MAVEGTGTPKRLFWGKLVEPYQAFKGIGSGTHRQLTARLAPGSEVAFRGEIESYYDCSKESHG
jgi:hypothetical protein